MAFDDIYDIGDLVEITLAYTDLAGAAADPTVVTLRILKPDGTVTVVDHGSLTHPTLGSRLLRS